MKVFELIARLEKCNPYAEVRIQYEEYGEDTQEDLGHVSQCTFFGAGDEGDDIVYVALSH